MAAPVSGRYRAFRPRGRGRRQVAAALDYAHGERIVHRDIKPANIMVETMESGRVCARILDFGLAAEIRSSMSRVSTESGDTSGTRPYMAPEQWLGKKQDGRTDQYALACVLYELLSGAPPFAGVFETGDPVIMKSAVVGDPLEEIEGFDPAVNAALLRALSKSPKDRFSSCSEFVDALLPVSGRARSPSAPQGGGGLHTVGAAQGGASRLGEPSQGPGGSPGGLAPPNPSSEAEVLRRKVAIARTLKNLPAEDRSDAKLSSFAEEADMELETAEEAFRYSRFAAAAQCLDCADEDLRKLAQTKADRKARQEAERRAREEAERKAREEAERKAREEVERRARKEMGMVQLWDGGPYWATRNIGAENPEDYGLYFWWGDTVGYYRRKGFVWDRWVASDGSSRKFSFSNKNTLTYGKDDAALLSEGWTTPGGFLSPEHDAAHVHWGGGWRMPTEQEVDDLKEKCDWTWTTMNDVGGFVVRGRGPYADASIFFPAAGCGSGTLLVNAGSRCYYWSSVPLGGSDSSAGLFKTSDCGGGTFCYRNYGWSVRPVQ